MGWLRRLLGGSCCLLDDKSTWHEATKHDIGLVAGGHVLHYSTCWCRKTEAKDA